jgi:hypothetical protein
LNPWDPVAAGQKMHPKIIEVRDDRVALLARHAVLMRKKRNAQEQCR